MAAMTGNRASEIGQGVDALQVTGFGDGQQTSRCQFTFSAAVSEADFAPLHAGAERSFSAVVGGLNALSFEEGEQSLVVFKQGSGEIPDLAVGTVQMPLGQGEDPLLDGDRADQGLASIQLAATKLVPESE